MVKSMTGFGKGEAALQNKKITVEIRSLNSKQLDLGLRLPAVYRQSEYEIRNIIARTIQRGKVDVFVTVESQAVETPARINKEVFREYLHQMTDTLAFAGIDADYDAIVPVIMRLPEVVSTETESISDEEHAALIAATEAAAARPANPRILDCEDARRSRHVHRGSEAGQMIRPGPEKHGVWPNLSLDNALLILGGACTGSNVLTGV